MAEETTTEADDEPTPECDEGAESPGRLALVEAGVTAAADAVPEAA